MCLLTSDDCTPLYTIENAVLLKFISAQEKYGPKCIYNINYVTFVINNDFGRCFQNKILLYKLKDIWIITLLVSVIEAYLDNIKSILIFFLFCWAMARWSKKVECGKGSNNYRCEFSSFRCFCGCLTCI